MAGRILAVVAGRSLLLLGLTLCACSCSKPESKAGAADDELTELDRQILAGDLCELKEARAKIEKDHPTGTLDKDGLTQEDRDAYSAQVRLRKEARAKAAEELRNGPKEDRLSAEERAKLEKQFGPVLPLVPFAVMRRFLPDKVGTFSRVTMSSVDSGGTPQLVASYESDQGGGKSEVEVFLQDSRQANGGMYAHYWTVSLSHSQHRPGIDVEKGSVGRFISCTKPRLLVAVIAGRFTVLVRMDKDFDMKIIKQFVDVIDFEKLSQVN